MCDSHCPTFWHVATLESFKRPFKLRGPKKKTRQLHLLGVSKQLSWKMMPFSGSSGEWILLNFEGITIFKGTLIHKRLFAGNREFGQENLGIEKTVINAFGILHHLGCSQVLSNGESKWFCGNNRPADSLSKQIHLMRQQQCLKRISKICPHQEVEKKMTVSCYPFNSSGMGRWSLVASR